MRRRDFLAGTTAATFASGLGGGFADGSAHAGDEAGAVLDESLAGGPPELMLHRWLMRQVAEAEAEADAVASGIEDADRLRAWQAATRQRFLDAIGSFPGRTPLNPRVIDTVQADGYRVEKILLESQPGHFVSGALFLPDPDRFAPPYPGILVPCGHSEKPRDRGLYQRPCVIAAMNGMASWLYDPLDQGERMQELDDQGDYQHHGTRGHNKIGVSAKLLGWNTARLMIWDGIRGLDFLAGRESIDGDRLGCMGISGGGTLTSYLMALDPRIVAAAPSCYITTLREVYAAIGPQDAEQTIFGQLGFGMDHAEYLSLFAPRPVRVCATSRDFFPIAGAKQAYERARGVYRRVGAGDRISFFEDDEQHTWSEPLRVASVQWMNRWLRGVDEMYVPPQDDMGIPAEQMRITEHAQVMRLPGARSAYDLMRDELDRLERERPRLTGPALRRAVRRRAGIRPLAEIPLPDVKRLGADGSPAVGPHKLVIAIRPEMLLPALLWSPPGPQGPPVLWAHGEGKSAAAGPAAALAAAGRTVLAVDLSGFGETQGTRSRFYGSHAVDEADTLIAYALGRSIVGIRAEDLLACARWLAGDRDPAAVELRAAGWAVTPALHAAVAEPDLFAEVRSENPPMPWRQVVREGDRHRFSDAVHGGLADYDLRQLGDEVKSRRSAAGRREG